MEQSGCSSDSYANEPGAGVKPLAGVGAAPGPKGSPREHEPNHHEMHSTDRDRHAAERRIRNHHYGRFKPVQRERQERADRERFEHVEEIAAETEVIAQTGEVQSHVDQFEVDNGFNAPNPNVKKSCRGSTVVMIGAGAVITVGLGAIAFLSYLFATGESPDPTIPPPDVPEDKVPEAFKEEFEAILQQWNDLDEADFWAELIQFVIDEDPSIYRQRYMVLTMGIAVLAREPNEPVIADGAAKIKVAYDADPKATTPYETASTLTFGDNNREMNRKERLGSILRFIDTEFPEADDQ